MTYNSVGYDKVYYNRWSTCGHYDAPCDPIGHFNFNSRIGTCIRYSNGANFSDYFRLNNFQFLVITFFFVDYDIFLQTRISYFMLI
jgi:hypothetical protein